MTDVLVNGVGWVAVPESGDGQSLSAGTFWSDAADETLCALLPHYPLARIAWTLGRTLPSIEQRIKVLGFERPMPWHKASPDNRGAVAA
jgi:hypothetical protein